MGARGRGRLILHALTSALLFGVLGGIVDAFVTTHQYFGPEFVCISAMTWTLCWLPVGAAIGACAALLAKPGPGFRSPLSLAALATAAMALFSAAIMIAAHLNIAYLPTYRSPLSLLVDTLVLALALAGTAALAPRLKRRFERRGATVSLLLHTLWGPPLVAAVALGIALAAWRGGASAVPAPVNRPPPDAPNVVLILIDTLRRDHLSGEGYELETSPGLDRVARAGTRFSRFYSQSCYTKPAVASLLTSLHPSGHQVGHLRSALGEGLLTLPELFHAAGYRTAMVCSNSIISEEFGFSQGAERFHTLPLELSPRSNLGYVLSQLSERGGHARLIRRFFTIVRRLERRLFWEARGDAVYLTAPQVTGAFEQWRSELPREDPFFAYLHYIEPHAPYSAPGEHAGRFASGAQVLVEAYPPMVGVFFPFSKGRALSDAEWQGMISAYDAEIAYLDALLERLVGDLLARGPGDRETLIAITADHGEEFYEHGGWGHGHSLHEEQIAIPLILVGRDVPVDREVTEITALIDLAPTLLELAGIAVPTEMEGRSLVGHLGEEGDAGRGVDPEAGVLSEIVYSETYWARSLIHEEWKLIVSRLAPRDSVQLFHLATDPEEGNDLSLDQPERVRKLTERMWELVDRSRRWASEPELRPLDPVARERLRALGYVE